MATGWSLPQSKMPRLTWHGSSPTAWWWPAAAEPWKFRARALGNRSITADPSETRIIPRINKMIKQRDFWMPFAPAVLLEDAREFLQAPDTLPARISPFMMHTFDTSARREEFVAGVHAYDDTARAQVVSAQSNAGFHEMIGHFKQLKNKGVVLNTSFNLHGWPIVMGSCDALEVMVNSDLTHLILEDFLRHQAPVKKVAFFVFNTANGDLRVHRQARLLSENGYEVRIYCFLEPGLPQREERFRPHHLPRRPAQSLHPLLRRSDHASPAQQSILSPAPQLPPRCRPIESRFAPALPHRHANRPHHFLEGEEQYPAIRQYHQQGMGP